MLLEKKTPRDSRRGVAGEDDERIITSIRNYSKPFWQELTKKYKPKMKMKEKTKGDSASARMMCAWAAERAFNAN